LRIGCNALWWLTFDISGSLQTAKPAGGCPLDGNAKELPPSGNGDGAPRLVVFKVINLKPLKGEVRGQGYPRRSGAGIHVAAKLGKHALQLDGHIAKLAAVTGRADRDSYAWRPRFGSACLDDDLANVGDQASLQQVSLRVGVAEVGKQVFGCRA